MVYFVYHGKVKKMIVNPLVSSYGKADDRLEVIWNHPCVLLKNI